MENIFVLTVLVALAAVGLLGAFLAASEKELKVKRREVEELLGRLESVSSQGAAAENATTPMADGAELAELRARNQELQNEINALSGKLELSRRSIHELEGAQENAQAMQAEIQELRAENEQLSAQLRRLQAQAADAGSAASTAPQQAAAERHAQLQNEIVELKQKLQESHAKLSEAEAYRQKAERLDGLEAERQKLQTRIAELENEVNATQVKLRETAELHQRMLEAEQAQAALRAESERRERELVQWRERAAEAEEYRRRLGALQRPYEELLAKHASLAEQQRAFENQLAAFARLMPSDTPPPAGAVNESTGASSARVVELSNAQSPSAPAPSQSSVSAGAAPEEKPRRRFGPFSALILVSALGLLGVQLLNSTSGQPPAPVVSARLVSVDRSEAPAVGGALEEREKETPPPRAQPSKSASIAEPSRVARQALPIAGTYEVTRASRVHAGPSEFSQPLGDIEPGTKVNVVGGRDGWLEIHSKYGRPPGFIRQEVAARLGEQN